LFAIDILVAVLVLEWGGGLNLNVAQLGFLSKVVIGRVVGCSFHSEIVVVGFHVLALLDLRSCSYGWCN
jgi:hypothetical protein